ncbi:YdcF family protein [Salinithrix halophila]|uniref:YdcF family protein n=1 Tax=Salinithrix halophila TaxID=1485204 RepID=A0ABV8JM65_9BACL
MQKRLLYAVLVGFLAGILLMAPFWSRASLYDDVSVSTKPSDAALILGAALWEGKPSPALKERLDMALQLYRRDQVQWLVLSGGVGKSGLSEAEGMKRYLVQQGVKPDHLLLEEQSTRTKENLFFSKRLLRKNNIDQVYLVTHDYHLFRSLAYAKQAGIRAKPAPVHSRVLFTPFYKSRECLAIIKWRMVDR